jgi:hypothetical protein
MRGRGEGPPEGWVAIHGLLEPAGHVAAYAARGQVVKGRCQSKGCNRRVDLDPKDLCGKHLGALPMHQLMRTYGCNRLDGCTLSFFTEPKEPPLRLEWLTGKAHVRLRLRCGTHKCTFFRIWLVEEMIAGLKKAGKGGGDTDVHELRKLMTSPCKLCKKVDWMPDVLWADTGTMGWRQLGERTFDAVKAAGGV